jgi:hypothetical protein
VDIPNNLHHQYIHFILITKLYVPEALNVKLGEFWNALPFTLYVAGKIVAEETVDKSIVNGYHHNKLVLVRIS